MVEIIFRTVFSFFTLLLLTRILGKAQMSQLTYFNYITGITIGSIAAMVCVDRRINVMDSVIGLLGWCTLAFLISYWSLKSPKARVILDSEPTIVIKKGEILEEAMKSLRLNMDDLSMLLRNKDVFSFEEVEYAIFEADGNLSVLKKVDQRPITKKDMNLTPKPPLFFPTEIISDGKIVERNLTELNRSRRWVEFQLKKQHVARISDVFYAEIQEDGSLVIDRYNDVKS